MELKINIKPQILQGKTIPQVLERVKRGGLLTLNSKFSSDIVITDLHSTYFLVYNIVKINAKRVRSGKGYKIIKYPLVTAYVYKFTPEILNVLGVKLKQNKRNFELIKK